MNKNELIQIEKAIGCRFTIVKTGHKDWERMFVINSKNIQIGRVALYKNEIYSINNYKRDYMNTLDETDFIFLRLSKYLKDRTIISNINYTKLINKAINLQKEDLEKKLKWRKNNPVSSAKQHRKRIEGKNIRNILSQLCYNL